MEHNGLGWANIGGDKARFAAWAKAAGSSAVGSMGQGPPGLGVEGAPPASDEPASSPRGVRSKRAAKRKVLSRSHRA